MVRIMVLIETIRGPLYHCFAYSYTLHRCPSPRLEPNATIPSVAVLQAVLRLCTAYVSYAVLSAPTTSAWTKYRLISPFYSP